MPRGFPKQRGHPLASTQALSQIWEVVIPAFPVSIFDEEIFAFDPTQLL